MSPRASRALVAAGLVFLAGPIGPIGLTACAPPPVDFARGLSTALVEPRPFRTALARWTRHAHITHDWDTALDAEVILVVPEMRVAYTAQVAATRKLPPAQRDAALAEAATTDRVDAWVFLQTSRWEWNDLSSLKSMWTISLIEGDRAVTSIDRQPLPEKPDELAQLFWWMTPFTRSWRVTFPTTFPDGTRVLRPDTRSITIRFAGPLGSADVRWTPPLPAR